MRDPFYLCNWCGENLAQWPCNLDVWIDQRRRRYCGFYCFNMVKKWNPYLDGAPVTPRTKTDRRAE